MPTYEYKCNACGHTFERFQSIKAAPIRKCPECGKSKVKRLIGIGAGLLFKGSGFYITDYRPESYNAAAKADAPPTSDAKPTEGAAKTEAKPQTKSEAKSESKSEAKSEPKAQTSAPKKKDSKNN
jgi:putative FmdB family regulatory protein